MEIIFIAGPPRSGTTLVQRMLQGGKPGVPECTYLTQQIEHYHEWTTYRDESRFPAYFGDKATALGMFRDIATVMLRRLASERAGEARLVLKDPGLSRVLPSLREIFPEAKIVSVLRDPVDVTASLKEVWERRAAIWDISDQMPGLWRDYEGVEQFAERGDRDAIVLRYEDVVQGRGDAIAALEQFVGFPLSWDSGEPWQIDRNDPFYVPTYGQPVTASRVGRGREVLSAEEVQMVETVFGGVRQRWQYT